MEREFSRTETLQMNRDPAVVLLCIRFSATASRSTSNQKMEKKCFQSVQRFKSRETERVRMRKSWMMYRLNVSLKHISNATQRIPTHSNLEDGSPQFKSWGRIWNRQLHVK